MKVCSSCGQKKKTGKFRKYYNGRKVRRTKCMACENRAKRDKGKARRIAAFKHFGEKCADCGVKSSSKNYIIFDFHHLEPSKKEFHFSQSIHLSDKRYWAEINKCVMLCSNCHRLRHWRLAP